MSAEIQHTEFSEALNSGKLGGAGLDVLSVEPAIPNDPLLSAKNCNLSPHISWATKEARARLMSTAVDNLKAEIEGNPINVVS